MKKTILSILICTFSFQGISQDGSFDLSFGDSGILELDSQNNSYNNIIGNHQQSDGSYLILSGIYLNSENFFRISSITDNGEIDPTFGNNGHVQYVNDPFSEGRPSNSAQLDDTKIIVSFLGYPDYTIKCFNLDGSLDSNFGQNGVLIPNDGQSGHFSVTNDGRFIVASQYEGAIRMQKYLNDGSLDSSFGNGGEVVTPLLNVKKLNDFKISRIDGSYFFAVRLHGSHPFRVVKLKANGLVDTTYGSDGFAVLPNGNNNNCTRNYIQLFDNNDVLAWKINKDIECSNYTSDIFRISYAGFVRPNFGNNGVLQMNSVQALIQENQRILFLTSPDSYWGGEVDLKRYTPWGELDDSFAFNGQTYGHDSNLSMDNVGKIMVDIVTGDDLLIFRLANNPLGNESFTNVGFAIYPNPVDDIMHIDKKLHIPIISVNFYDTLGRKVLTINEDVNQIDLSKLNSGLLFLEIETEQGTVTKKVVKQ